MYDFSLKTVLVTGSSRGIGAAIAKNFLMLDANVVITSANKRPEWVDSYPNAKYLKLNFLEKDSLDLFSKEIDKMNSIDILINNAGVYSSEPITDFSSTILDELFKINVEGPAKLIKKVSRGMIHKSNGRIVNICSIAPLVIKKNSASYVASKSALHGLTKSAAIDLAPFNILVNSISPGPTDTDMLGMLSSLEVSRIKESIPLQRFATPDEVANLAIFLSSDKNTYITGQDFIIDGGRTLV
jgi:3-oxoacyl-[acyl-carrier protein] reductase